MRSRQTTIMNKTGLHARPASEFVLLAKKYESKITIRNLSENGQPVNAKSIIMLLGEGMGQGTQIEITASGADEEKAVEDLISLIDTGFKE